MADIAEVKLDGTPFADRADYEAYTVGLLQDGTEEGYNTAVSAIARLIDYRRRDTLGDVVELGSTLMEDTAHYTKGRAENLSGEWSEEVLRSTANIKAQVIEARARNLVRYPRYFGNKTIEQARRTFLVGGTFVGVVNDAMALLLDAEQAD